MKVRVTRKHVAAGDPGECSTCPVALAISSATGCHCEVTAEYGSASVDITRGPGDVVRLELPERAYRFVRDFDAGAAVRPFSFELGWEAEKGRAER